MQVPNQYTKPTPMETGGWKGTTTPNMNIPGAKNDPKPMVNELHPMDAEGGAFPPDVASMNSGDCSGPCGPNAGG